MPPRFGDGSARDRVEQTLARIARLNPALHAIVIERGDEARREADALDRDGQARGLLHGVPVTVKEAFAIAGLATTVNSRLLRRHVATRDALAVRRLRDAGAVIVGKTNVPAWLADYQCFGPIYPAANNPFDLKRTPGGSSGGGAAAVAAGFAAIDIGSDLAGSIRVPAHFCGVVGFKPGDNFAELGDGHVPPWPGRSGGLTPMVAVGALARSVFDVERAWRVIAMPPTDDGSPTGPWRIAWHDAAGAIGCDRDTKAVVQGMLQRWQGFGAAVERRPLDRDWHDEACAVWALLAGAMAGQGAPFIVRRLMQAMFGWAKRGTDIAALRRWREGLDLDAADVARLLSRRAELIAGYERLFAGCDFIVGPVAAGPAFHHDRSRGAILRDGVRYAYLDYAMPFAVPFNAAGAPVLVLPAGMSGEGLPIGVQIAAPPGGEARLLAFGRWLEAHGQRAVAPPLAPR